jgi:Tat protein secretion system quality control protein TatD with DNase activity
VAERIAAVRGLAPDELIARTSENAARVFGLHLPRAESIAQ